METPEFHATPQPISLIPEDVLVLIFSLIKQPERTTAICQRWRTVALQTASLWTDIVFDLSSTRPLEKPKAWIERSKEALIDIVVKRSSLDNTSGTLSTHERMIATILPHAHRWRSFKTEYLLQSERLISVKELVGIPFPELQILQIGQLPLVRVLTFTNLELRNEDAPKLKHLRLPKDGELRLKDGGVIASLTHLTELEIPRKQLSRITATAATQLCHILGDCTQLRSLTVSQEDSWEDTYSDEKVDQTLTVVAANLRQLNLPTSLLASTIQVIRFPSVTTFEDLDPHILPLINKHKPFPNLRALVIYPLLRSSWDHRLSEIPGFLGVLLHIEALTIYDLRWTGNRDSGWIKEFIVACPTLKTLQLHWNLGFQEAAIKEMVEGRIAVGTPLRSLVFILDGGCEEDEEEEDPIPNLSGWLRSTVPNFKFEIQYGVWGDLFV